MDKCKMTAHLGVPKKHFTKNDQSIYDIEDPWFKSNKGATHQGKPGGFNMGTQKAGITKLEQYIVS